MARLTPLAALALACGPALAQPPALLPASVTGATPPGSVRAASETAAPPAPAVRLMNDLRAYPRETQAALFATRQAADALARANLPSGRFILGDGVEDDCAQATAALALAEAAAFTGDARLSARAGGAVLSLLTLTELDPANSQVRHPVAQLKGDPARFAAALALAILAQPTRGEAQVAEAGRLGAYLLTRVKPSGEVEIGPGTPEAVAATPGLVLEALVAIIKSCRGTLCQAGAMKVVGYYAQPVKASDTMTAAALVPGFVEVAALSKNDPRLVAATFALADAVADSQVHRERDAMRDRELAAAVRGLSRAAWLTRQVPDAERFHKYRASALAGLALVAARPGEPVGVARAGVAFLTSGAEGTPQ